ncbi:hypothetical protein ACJX0J_006560, partial [Zea mays]
GIFKYLGSAQEAAVEIFSLYMHIHVHIIAIGIQAVKKLMTLWKKNVYSCEAFDVIVFGAHALQYGIYEQHFKILEDMIVFF